MVVKTSSDSIGFIIMQCFFTCLTIQDYFPIFDQWCMISRFKREEMKIQAWENHQKAKTEAEMRRVEVCAYYLILFLSDFIF